MSTHRFHMLIDWAAGLYGLEEAAAIGLRGDRLWDGGVLLGTDERHFLDIEPWCVVEAAAWLLSGGFPDVFPVYRYGEVDESADVCVRAFETVSAQPPLRMRPTVAAVRGGVFYTMGRSAVQSAILAFAAGNFGLTRSGREWAKSRGEYVKVPRNASGVFAQLSVDLDVLLPPLGEPRLSDVGWQNALAWATPLRKHGRLLGVGDGVNALVPVSRLVSLALVAGADGGNSSELVAVRKRHVREFLTTNRVVSRHLERIEAQLPQVLEAICAVAIQPVTSIWRTWTASGDLADDDVPELASAPDAGAATESTLVSQAATSANSAPVRGAPRLEID